MAQINVTNLTFAYEGNYTNIFDNVSFLVDTDWKLGLIGRNGKGKTTFLNLLLGKYKYQGSIKSSTTFDYFPYDLSKVDINNITIDIIEQLMPDYELWKICRELDLLSISSEILYDKFSILSQGQRTKVMLAMLFSKENNFLLIDEPTNHLDISTREIVCEYLNRKKGFMLVSHDRWVLDNCVDHILSLERNKIDVQKGNFSSWLENKEKQDTFEKAENEKLKQEIRKLEGAAQRTSMWAQKIERSKIGFDPIQEHDRFLDTRAYIGEKSKRMQQRRKNLQRRQNNAIEDKSKLLKNLEETVELKLIPIEHYKSVYVSANGLSISYGERTILSDFDFCIKKGERVVINGQNGCGKSSLIKSILSNENVVVLNDDMKDYDIQERSCSGKLIVAKGLKISYINQDTSKLCGMLLDYAKKINVTYSLLLAILRQLDFEREQFIKPMETYSEGQKKKVLLSGSLLQQAHLYIWDEPLNYIDVFSRMQIERLILNYKPTMLIVEHDKAFSNNCGTKIIDM